ncbi:MAG: hypothetical protein GEU90_06935 [Gemmatimonas sp.]|nr:hypothetical protein [Gemmatimonas sp.]
MTKIIHYLTVAAGITAAVAPLRLATAQDVLSGTVDVSGDWVFLDFGASSFQIDVADPVASSEWDLGILGTTVSVNGGESGPGDVVAYCICRNQGLGDEEIQALAVEAALADFESVGTADLPTDPGAWDGGVFDTNPWYRYNLAGQHLIWPTYDVFLIKRGDEVYKIQFVDFYTPDGEPRNLTIRYAKLAD